MGGFDQTRQTVIRINIDCCHQVETKECQVSKVILCETFAPEVRMDATKSAKAVDGYAYAFEIRQLDAPVVAHHHVFYMAASIDKRANLSPGLMREFCELPREFRRYDLMRSDSPRVELCDAAELIRFETGSIAENVFNVRSLPFARLISRPAKTD
jgi:hypothetical protein